MEYTYHYDSPIGAIPYGQTMTYKEIAENAAKRIGDEMYE